MIKNFLQKIFKTASYGLFFKIYGKIEESIKADSDNKIKIKIVNPEKNLNYKIYSVADGRLYTDRVHDTAVIVDNKIVEGPSFQFRRGTPTIDTKNEPKIYNSNIRDNVVFRRGTPRKLKNLSAVALQ